MADNSSSFASSLSPNLLCEEDESCLIDDRNDNPSVYNHVRNSPTHMLVEETTEDEEEFVRNLVQKEGGLRSSASSSCSVSRFPSTSSRPAAVSPVNQSWLRNARLDSITWMINTANRFGFRYRTAYLSLTYYDHFLSIRTTDGEDPGGVRLLSIACLSLATKMVGDNRTPNLSEYTTGLEGCVFPSKIIMQMELLVLTTFEWNMCFVTPFPYIHYFIDKLWKQQSKPCRYLKPKVLDLIMAVIKEIKLVEYRPSIIAAAAALVANDCTLTPEMIEFKISSVSLWASDQQNNQLISCCNLMQEVERRLSTPKSLISPETGSSSVQDTETSCVTTTKRRLAFSDDGQDSLPDKHRRL